MRGVITAWAALVWVAVGCSEGRLVDSSLAGVGSRCELQDACASGLVCLDGACRPEGAAASGRRCQIDAECDQPELCLGGVCRPQGAGDDEALAPQDDAEYGPGAAPGGEEDKGEAPGLGDPPAGDGGDGGDGGAGGDPAAQPDPDPDADPDPDPEPNPDPDPDPGAEPDPEPVVCDPDRFEPNDQVADATPIAFNADEQGLTACAGDTDLFVIDLAQGTPFSATVSGAAGLRVELVEADGVTVSSRSRAQGDGARTGLAAIPVGGRHYVRVAGAAPATYRLQISAADPDDNPVGADPDPNPDPDPGNGNGNGECREDIFEPNNGFNTAVPFGPGLYPLLQICDGNADLFMVDLRAGDTLSASIVFDPDEADLDLAMHGPAPDAPLMDLSDGLIWAEDVQGTAFEDGWHYLAIYPFDFVGGTGYLLTIDVAPAGG